ncbi:hypothetical protein B0A52_09237 [Exophiala mesophila]|uniref:Vacuolar sorting protein Vps3844 C-terminal domain-containing protein n=1 Tax=Exophiala mesophila TaxID=212818 RepID=A0A438MTN3_EXOME|nr:hypothetical protein B0A52_09237 [Exophiala mesophila]
MRSLTSILSAAALLHHVSANSAYLFTIDRSVVSSSTAMIDSDLASAIIARRRSLTADRHLGLSSESALEDLNNYGGYQLPLFGAQPATEAPGKLFIRIHGVDMSIAEFDSYMPDLWIEDAATDLLTDFKAVDNRLEKDGMCEYSVPPSLNAPGSKDVEVIFSYPLDGEPSCLHASEIPTIPVILSLQHYLPTSPSDVKSQITGLVRILKHLSATQNVESTVLLLPTTLAKSKPHAHHNHHARSVQLEEEEPLDLPLIPFDSSVKAATDGLISQSNATSNFTLPLTLPACFTSQASCENTTNFCSGHGNCYEAHNACFKCRCGSTLARTNPDGTNKTTQWGGAACQKKDISVPFLMFAAFGVFFAAVIAGGIGLLYNMGSEPLPSVIGAGVAGPKAGK